MRTARSLLLWFCIGTAVFGAVAKVYSAPATAPVKVIFWFDTEDYLLPADDDATKRLCEMFTERGIRATFKIVGEKARVLEKRGRQDVISALKKHDIGYHSNLHSVHPTPSEYLAECGLLDGIAEFVRREAGGAADVRRILGVPTLACYGQPGSSWAAQAIAALPQIGVAPMGVPCYVDEGTHVGLNAQPFWFAGALVVYDMRENVTRMDLHEASALTPAKEKFSRIAQRLAEKNGGGLISIFYHPCEWVHQQFWDGVNFSRGANPPREEWKAPPQRTKEETEAAFQRFGAYLDHIRTTPGIEIVTASELPGLYADALHSSGATAADLKAITSSVLRSDGRGIDYLVSGGKTFSVADQFVVLGSAVGSLIGSAKIPMPIRVDSVLGPDQAAPRSGTVISIPWTAFRDAVRDTQSFIETEKRIPSRVFIGADAVAPADFLFGLTSVAEYFESHASFPETVSLGRKIELLPAAHVAKDTPELFGGWVIHRAGFRAPKILEVARLQAWTLKPAILKSN